ncbi:MAG: aldose 1-epimerase [Bacteroidetes bacterium]|nr:MAG: aldose 1-epimerase [Bacteroidota bacterium]
MGYSINHIEDNGLNLVLLKDELNSTEVAILPEFGALLHSFRIRGRDRSVNVIDNYRDLLQVQNEIGRSFKSARLSPYPCRIPEGKYVYEGAPAEFNRKFVDGSSIHGLLYDKPFKVLQEFVNDQMASVSLQYRYEKDDLAYPFKYDCRVKYSLQGDSILRVETTVTNQSDGPIPIADGWHPYFQLGGKIDEWMLYFDSDSLIEFDEKLIPTGKLIKYDQFQRLQKIGTTELDNCFVLKDSNGHAVCELINPQNNLKVSFYPDRAYSYLQIFTPPHRKSIAIENLSAAPDCFNNKMGLILLPPGDSQSFTVRYRVSWS